MIDASIRRLRYTGTKEALNEVLARGPHGISRAMSREEVVAADFWQEMESAGLLDFDSILHRGWHLIRIGVAGNEFFHLLVDETQDTGRMDWKIYEAMPTPNKYYVGDTDQSIYGFRGGSPEFLTALATAPGTEAHYLNGNYRCGEFICDAANAVVSNVANRLPKRTESQTGEAGTVTATAYDNQAAEIVGIATRLHGVNYEDCAVLLRLNKHVEIYAAGLAAMGVPVRRRQTEDRPAYWRDAKQLVALCANPDNDWLAYDWICKSVGRDAAQEAKRHAAEDLTTINEVIPEPMKHGMNIAEAIVELGKARCSKAAIEAIEQLAAQLDGSATLNDLLIAIHSDTTATDDGSGVVVGTIHGSKGREFSTVFLPAFEQGIIPANRDVDEERRLTFVGMTRAKAALHVSHAARRPNLYTKVIEAAEPSQFVSEAEL